MNLHHVATFTALSLFAISQAIAEDASPMNGQRVFGACAACHSLQADKNMTGPSLAKVWGRKAGSLASFHRYSDALQSSGVVWNDQTLDQWIQDPQHFIPGNNMTFSGIKNAKARADLLAFLKETTQMDNAQSIQRGGMGGMMGGGQVPNLKTIDPEGRVRSITYCGDTYTVTTDDGKVHKFWERNLRLKTDASVDGPERNAPALVGAGMMGDRADVIFASPSEIGASISQKC